MKLQFTLLVCSILFIFSSAAPLFEVRELLTPELGLLEKVETALKQSAHQASPENFEVLYRTANGKLPSSADPAMKAAQKSAKKAIKPLLVSASLSNTRDSQLLIASRLMKNLVRSGQAPETGANLLRYESIITQYKPRRGLPWSKPVNFFTETQEADVTRILKAKHKDHLMTVAVPSLPEHYIVKSSTEGAVTFLEAKDFKVLYDASKAAIPKGLERTQRFKFIRAQQAAKANTSLMLVRAPLSIDRRARTDILLFIGTGFSQGTDQTGREKGPQGGRKKPQTGGNAAQKSHPGKEGPGPGPAEAGRGHARSPKGKAAISEDVVSRVSGRSRRQAFGGHHCFTCR